MRRAGKIFQSALNFGFPFLYTLLNPYLLPHIFAMVAWRKQRSVGLIC